MAINVRGRSRANRAVAGSLLALSLVLGAASRNHIFKSDSYNLSGSAVAKSGLGDKVKDLVFQDCGCDGISKVCQFSTSTDGSQTTITPEQFMQASNLMELFGKSSIYKYFACSGLASIGRILCDIPITISRDETRCSIPLIAIARNILRAHTADWEMICKGSEIQVAAENLVDYTGVMQTVSYCPIPNFPNFATVPSINELIELKNSLPQDPYLENLSILYMLPVGFVIHSHNEVSQFSPTKQLNPANGDNLKTPSTSQRSFSSHPQHPTHIFMLQGVTAVDQLLKIDRDKRIKACLSGHSTDEANLLETNNEICATWIECLEKYCTPEPGI